MGSTSEKIDKAVQFLAFPDIREISSDVTKAKFLKSRGLNHDEVKEALIRHYVASDASPSQDHLKSRQCFIKHLPSVRLNPIASDYSNDGTVAVIQNTQSGTALSKFFSFCQKLVLFAGVVSSFYYAYQKWARARDAKKKSEKTMREEINILRNELKKISSELRHYQLLERNNATLLKEVNSLKAILVGRQQFEEKQTGKVALPSWQLNDVDSAKAATISTDSSLSNGTESQETVSTCADKVAPLNNSTKIENIPTSTPEGVDTCAKKAPLQNGFERSSEQPLLNSSGVKEAKKNAHKPSNSENEQKTKKSEKKN